MGFKITGLEQLKYFLKKLKEIFVLKTDVATSDTLGLVKPDNKTIVITKDGSINIKLTDEVVQELAKNEVFINKLIENKIFISQLVEKLPALQIVEKK